MSKTDVIEMKASDYEKAISECPRNREWIRNRAAEILREDFGIEDEN